ncbi:hypothetical protein [uncultured Prevotella sp.]|uniref:hypothetical protein n=1 Tax=uncultured Prevotella sp. TaxID=159272 RepID=UPI002588D74E|nr:hypothetical protein [uncultured Prevotella sp.]
MNKIFKSMMAMTIAAFTFTACEDVPEPYNNPYDSLKGEEPIVVEPTGEGTEDSPYNVAGINSYAEAIAAGQTDTKTIYVTGIICSVDNFQEKYGEIDYHIADDAKGLSSQFYVYGGYGLDGAKFTSISELSVGDTVTVAGTITNYQGTLEFQYGSKILSLKKGNGSSTETPDVKTVGSKDTPKTVAEALTAINAMEDGATSEEFWYIKGTVKKINSTAANITNYKNIDYVITDDGNNELTVFRGKNLDNTDFTSADELPVGTEVVVYGQIQKYINTKTSAMTPEIAQGNYIVAKGGSGTSGDLTGVTGSGTAEDPYNIAAINEIAAKLEKGQTSEQDYYFKGKVVKIATDKNGVAQNYDNGTYGNASFYISDDGTETNQFYVYRALYLENKKWEAGAGDILKVGDEVVICGKLTNYNGTLETAQNKAYLYSLNAGDTANDGSLKHPFTAAEANAYATALGKGNTSTEDFYIKGIVVKIATDKNGVAQNYDNGTYGNATFYISEDGTETNLFYVYRALYLGNKKWEAGAGDIVKAGDQVIICGKLTNYNDTPETAQNKAYLYSLNGKTE